MPSRKWRVESTDHTHTNTPLTQYTPRGRLHGESITQVLGRGGNVPSLRKPHRNVGWCSSCARKKLQRVHRRNGHLSIVKKLIAAGADVNARRFNDDDEVTWDSDEL